MGGRRTDDKAAGWGEFGRVRQVLRNRRGKAIRYAHDQSQIWLRIDGEADRATVTVADQGQGLSADQQAVVFEKFERPGRTDSGGSGLGLYIARRLARALDGDLVIDSPPGPGARVTPSLPARDEGSRCKPAPLQGRRTEARPLGKEGLSPRRPRG